MALPKVSGILPVGCGDRFFMVAAIAFLTQRYEGDLELVVVDNSDEPIEDLLPDDDRIKYYRCERMGVGALRNLGTSYATGKVCITIDEDDWSHHDRIAVQVQRLLDTGKSVTGFHSVYYHDASNGGTYKYWYEPSGRPHPPYACGTSQCYLRSWWEKHNFPPGLEDFAFAQEALIANQLDSTDGAQLVVVRAHADSVCAPGHNLGTHRQFPAVPKFELPIEFFAAITPSANKPNKSTKQKQEK